MASSTTSSAMRLRSVPTFERALAMRAVLMKCDASANKSSRERWAFSSSAWLSSNFFSSNSAILESWAWPAFRTAAQRHYCLRVNDYCSEPR